MHHAALPQRHGTSRPALLSAPPPSSLALQCAALCCTPLPLPTRMEVQVHTPAQPRKQAHLQQGCQIHLHVSHICMLVHFIQIYAASPAAPASPSQQGRGGAGQTRNWRLEQVEQMRRLHAYVIKPGSQGRQQADARQIETAGHTHTPPPPPHPHKLDPAHAPKLTHTCAFVNAPLSLARLEGHCTASSIISCKWRGGRQAGIPGELRVSEGGGADRGASRQADELVAYRKAGGPACGQAGWQACLTAAPPGAGRHGGDTAERQCRRRRCRLCLLHRLNSNGQPASLPANHSTSQLTLSSSSAQRSAAPQHPTPAQRSPQLRTAACQHSSPAPARPPTHLG